MACVLANTHIYCCLMSVSVQLGDNILYLLLMLDMCEMPLSFIIHTFSMLFCLSLLFSDVEGNMKYIMVMVMVILDTCYLGVLLTPPTTLKILGDAKQQYHIFQSATFLYPLAWPSENSCVLQ